MTKSCANCLYEPICEQIMDPCGHYRKKIIRCKDCRYFSKGTIKGKHVCMYFKNRVVIETSEDGFCSRAEKKDEHSTDERLTLQDISERIVDSITWAERKER